MASHSGPRQNALDPASGATHTGSFAVWFEVSNGAPAPGICGIGAVPVATHGTER
jgi:hypothetical protein